MKKRTFSLILGILFIFTVCLAPFPANAVSRDTTTIRIVHTNDIHGYYTNTENGQIGFSALKALIDRQDADLVLDAGDTFHGQAFATVEQGMSIAELMDSVGYDAMTPGNHDWSYGKDRLKELDIQTDFPILAANVIREDGSPFFQNPYLIKEATADDGTPIKVGVFGVIDDALYSSTPPANVEDLTFTEETAKATETAQLLREKEECDIVLCLTHQTDCEGFVAATRGIDAVIAGHEHKLIDEEYKDLSGNTVPVVEAGYYFQNVGILSITLNKTDGTVKTESTFLTAEDTVSLSDEGVSSLISAIEERENRKLDQPVGMGIQEYPYSWEEIRTSDQAIGRIVANAYLDATGADIAFENAGGIRGGLPAGDITYRDIIGISPYGNILVTRELTGQQVLNILEHSIELSIQCNAVYDLQKEAVANGEDPYQYTWPDNSGSVLQVSGIQVYYDPSKPAGSRILRADVGGKPLETGRTYMVATNSYVVTDSEYPDIVQANPLYEYTTCEQAIIQYIQKGSFEEGAAQKSLIEVSSQIPSTPDSSGESSVPSSTGEPPASSQPEDTSPPTGDSVSMIFPVLLFAAAGTAAFLVSRKELKRG